jgi:di/tricarboxylate transporter
MMVPIQAASAFLNNTPLVAMFIPTIRDWALRHRISPSKFMMPLSYAAIFGGVCTLIGTSTNLVVNGLYQQSCNRSLEMFELAWVGIPCAIVSTLYMVTVGFRLLPDRRDLSLDFESSGREYLLEMKLLPDSPLVGKSIEDAGLRSLEQLFLVEIERNGQLLTPVKPSDTLEAWDRLYFTGQAEAIVRVQGMPGIVPSHERDFCENLRRNGKGRVIEAVVSRSSPMLGKTLKEGNFRARYDASVLAVHRHGERLPGPLGNLELKPGDTLLLLAGDDFYKRWNQARDFYMISKLIDMPVINRRKTAITILSLLGMIGLSATGVMDILNAAILAAVVLLMTRCITVVEARRSIELNVLIVIAAALGISTALEKTGAARYLAMQIIDAVRGFGPIGLLAAICLATTLLTEFITNNAAAALVFPIAMSAAQSAGLDPKPFVIAIAISASASFATPIGYQTNLMVQGPGGYTFRDFLRVGLPLNLLFMGTSIVVIPLVWGF